MKSARRFLATVCALAAAAVAAGTQSRDTSDQELDEVTVYGSQAQLSDLRRAMVEAEDRFYTRYNALNTNEDFDIACREEAPTGTQLKRRSCRALYEERAIREEGVEGFKIRQFLHEPNTVKYMPASPPVPAAAAIEARRPEFQRNMRDMLRRNEELVGLLSERAAAIGKFQAARRAAFQSKTNPRSSPDSTTTKVQP